MSNIIDFRLRAAPPPSDTPLAGLSEAELDALLARARSEVDFAEILSLLEVAHFDAMNGRVADPRYTGRALKLFLGLDKDWPPDAA